MDARVNISNQEVFRLAREADKDGSRTVGVITKCDALQRGDEKEVCQTSFPSRFRFAYRSRS